MASYIGRDEWRIKITGLSLDVTAFDLSNQFEVPVELISIPKSQANSSKLYAFIDGFKSKIQAVTFVSQWNEAFERNRINMRCEIDDNDARDTRNRKMKNFDTQIVLRK